MSSVANCATSTHAVAQSKLTAVLEQQRAEGNFVGAGETRHHLAVRVSTAAEVPLLEPVEVAGAGQGVVPQDAAGGDRQNGTACLACCLQPGLQSPSGALWPPR